MIEESQATFTVRVPAPNGQEFVCSGLSKDTAEWLERKLTAPTIPLVSTITDTQTQEAWFKCKSIASHMYRDAVRWTEAHYGIVRRGD